MRTFDFTPHYRSTVSSAPPASRAAVRSDPKLTTAEKRAVLASWISDVRAVEDASSLRWLDSGAVVEVDAILQALRLLDEAPDHRDERKRLPASRRRRSANSRWRSRVGPPNGSNDHDDDPPPAPAGLGIPFRPKFLAARRAPLGEFG
jgi:hypothetical protein